MKSIEFLNKLANVLSDKIKPEITADAVNMLFSRYLMIDKTEFIIWDNRSMLLKNFSRLDNCSRSEEAAGSINLIYNSLAQSDGKNFYFNEEEFSCELKSDDEYRIDDLNSDDNIIAFPLVSNGAVFGLISMKCRKKALSYNLFELLNIASKLISGAVINHILNEQASAGLSFYRAMKDIAKIIESQYELNYIIPLIGEMIDRFMPSHLIYIFMYKENKFSLVWPKACKDETVYKLLEQADASKEYILSKDNKTGIFPITVDGTMLGAAAAYSNADRLGSKDIDYLVQLARQAGLTINRANMYAEVLKYAALDALTGLNNRRQFEIRIKQEVSKSRRNNIPLCCIMLDADYFKKINDTCGHAAGDCVLKKIAEVIMQEIREYDTAFRYGGEEFFIILPETKLNEAVSAAERLRRVIEKTKIEIKDSKTDEKKYVNITISLGVCAYDGVMEAEEFAAKADKALYKSKESGRNRVTAV